MQSLARTEQRGAEQAGAGARDSPHEPVQAPRAEQPRRRLWWRGANVVAHNSDGHIAGDPEDFNPSAEWHRRRL